MKGLETINLTKRFGEVVALDQVSIRIEPGKIYGLLGRNGAGKSTLLNLLANRIFADSGQALVDGEEVTQNTEAIGKIYMMSVQNLYPESMKVKEAFRWSSSFYPEFDETEAYRLAEEFRLPVNKKIKGLSTGYQSLFKLIIALCSNAPYIFLDEPVLGLDANNRDRIYKYWIEKYLERNSTIILSTHIIEEVATMIEEVIIIHDGKITTQDSVESLLARYYRVAGPKEAVEQYVSGRKVQSRSYFGNLQTVLIEGKPEPQTADNIEISKPNLQDLFIQLTGDETQTERNAS